jgi:hypothetical protein
LISLAIRLNYRPWLEHPVYGHRRAVSKIQRLDPSTPWWRIRAGFPKPGPRDFERFYEIPHKTIAGDLTVGDYVRPLKKGSLSREEQLRLVLSYYHGAELVAGSEEVAGFAQLGRRLRALGCRTVAYQSPLPVETCVDVLGPGFASLAANNWRLIDEAYRAGLGGDATILQTGTVFAPGEFIDPIESEHLNGPGRVRLTEMIAAGLAAELQPTTPSGSNGAVTSSSNAARASASSERHAATSQKS